MVQELEVYQVLGYHPMYLCVFTCDLVAKLVSVFYLEYTRLLMPPIYRLSEFTSAVGQTLHESRWEGGTSVRFVLKCIPAWMSGDEAADRSALHSRDEVEVPYTVN